MSLINDALKRTQDDQTAGPGAMAGVPVYQKAPERGLRREVLLISLLVILVVLLFGGLVGTLVYLRTRPAGPATASPPVTAPAAPKPSLAPQSRYGKSMAKAKAVAGSVAALDQEGREAAAAIGGGQPVPATTVPVPPPAAPVPPVAVTPPVPAPAAAPQATPAPAPRPPPPAPAVRTAYKLSGIIGRPPVFTALVNGRMLKAGDRLDGAVVVSVEVRRVVIQEADGKTVELIIQENP